MDYATLDLTLAVAHHVLVFALAGILAFEIGVIRPGMTANDVLSVSKVDLWYGILAAAILIVGFSRAHLAAKGWAFYSANAFFWAKMGTFALVGILSIMPTVAIFRWKRALARNGANLPEQANIQTVRFYLWAEAALFVLIVSFAAAMARGYG